MKTTTRNNARTITQTINAKVLIPKRKDLDYTGMLVQTSKYKRSSMSVRDLGSALEVVVTATDTTALRASLNSLLRDLQVIESVARSVPRPLKPS